MDIIKVEGLSKSFGEIKAVSDISFSVKKGSLFAFLGLNGAGKSTTINILCSLLSKDAGSVNIGGFDLDKESEQIKQIIGIVFQKSVLDEKLTVKGNLISRAGLYGLDKAETKERIKYVTDKLDLEEILSRPYGKLSGGQRRRVDIARALLNEPEILFLDEPTTGLDPNTRIKVWSVIDQLRKEKGMTVFLTTHYMEETVRADKVVILDGGRIACDDTPDALKSCFTSDMLRIISSRDEKTEENLKNQQISFEYKNNSYYCKFKDGRSALDFLNKNSEITDFEIIKGDMDSVFLNVTGKSLKEAQ